MAHIATLKILVDEPNQAAVYDGINGILWNAQLGGPNGEDRDWVVDWKFDSVEPVNESLNDSIANETYAEGDAFDDWVIFSRSEAIAQDGAGFWSNEYGWTTLDLSTKFEDASVRDLPHSAGMDAVLAPYRMNFYRLMLVENPDDATLNQTPIAFEWVGVLGNFAENAYQGCKVVGTEGGDHE